MVNGGWWEIYDDGNWAMTDIDLSRNDEIGVLKSRQDERGRCSRW